MIVNKIIEFIKANTALVIVAIIVIGLNLYFTKEEDHFEPPITEASIEVMNTLAGYPEPAVVRGRVMVVRDTLTHASHMGIVVTTFAWWQPEGNGSGRRAVMYVPEAPVPYTPGLNSRDSSIAVPGDITPGLWTFRVWQLYQDGEHAQIVKRQTETIQIVESSP